jgi:hypothetical protein
MTRVMFDSVDVMALPPGADLYAGYDDGAWPDANAIATRFPGKPVIRITTNPADNEGDMLDVETGDARPTDAPNWAWRRRMAGSVAYVYCDESNWGAVADAFAITHIPPPLYLVAAYPGAGPSIPAGAIGHQWVDRGAYDESTMADYLPGIDSPPPPPAPHPSEPQGEDVYAIVENGLLHVFGVVNGVPFHWYQASPYVPVAGRSPWNVEQMPT